MYDNIKFEILLEKIFSEGLSPDEEKEFEDILAESKEAAERFSKANRMHEALRSMQINADRPDTKLFLSTVKKRNRLKRIGYQIAAILMLPLTIGLSVYFTSSRYDNILNSSLNEVVCEIGQRAKVKLPDGSEVLLESNSKLTYPALFTNNERNVTLDGEAVFKVQSDKENPFYVSSSVTSPKVMAHGTEFRVINYKDEDKLYVFLKHGKVDFIPEQSNKTLSLDAGEELIYNKENQYVSIQEASRKYSDIEQGIYRYKEVALEQFVTELNRRFKTQIEIEDSSLKNIRFTGSLQNETQQDIINMILLSSPSINWKMKDDNIILYRKLNE